MVKRKFFEQSFLFLTVARWVLLSAAAGALVGVSTAIFLKALNWSTFAASSYKWYFLFMPAGFLASSLLTRMSPESKGHGTEKVIEAVHQKDSNINVSVVPVKLLSTVITIASGGSAGKEGPCAQIGAAMASLLARMLKFDSVDRRKLVICGISAGFSSVFGTPIAGAIFGVEVLFVGGILYDVLLPSIIAGIVSFRVTEALGVTYSYHVFDALPSFGHILFIQVILAGIFFGLVSFMLIEILRLGEKMASALKMNEQLKAILAGTVLAVFAMAVSTRYLGLGLETIQSALDGKAVPLEAFFMKSVFTSATLSFGGSGGIVTPIFFIGSASGNALARIFNLDVSVFSALGFVAVLAGAANTPIAAIIMSIELFGPGIAPYAAAACAVSFLITGHRSVYPGQILSFGKSRSIEVETGKAISKVNVSFPRFSGGNDLNVKKGKK